MDIFWRFYKLHLLPATIWDFLQFEKKSVTYSAKNGGFNFGEASAKFAMF